MSPEFYKSTSLLFFLLNPLFMSIYLLGFFETLDQKTFRSVLIRGATIALVVFCLFGIIGDRIFNDVLHSRFFSFQIFGGLIFLIIGVQMVFNGVEALNTWRGDPDHIAGAIAMPFFIGPGTVMASVMTGIKLTPTFSILSIATAVISAVICIVFLKYVYDHLSQKRGKLLQGYVNIVGRVMALVVGTFSIEMLLQGFESWIVTLNK